MAAENRKKVEKVILSCLFIGGLILLIWKIPYGWGAYDEPYYPAIASRFVSGDRPGIDEWDSGQWSSMLLTPFVMAYMRITGSSEGIIFFFRVLFVIFQTIVSGMIIRMLKRHGITAYIAGVFFLLYVPFNLMAVSYDTIGLQAMTLSICIFYTKHGVKSRWMIASGFLFACAVLCNPLLAAVYLIVLISAIMKKIQIKPIFLKIFPSE